MTSINVKVIGLTRSEIEPAGSGLEPAIFRFPDLPAREAGALLIRPPRLVMPGFVKLQRKISNISTVQPL